MNAALPVGLPALETRAAATEPAQPLALIVDDDASDRLILTTLLNSHGFATIEVTDGLAACNVCEERIPDIVFMDVVISVLDGFAATQRIKSQHAEHFIPVIFLTATSDERQLARCIEAGGDDVLIKPYNAILLKAKIDAALRNRDMHRHLRLQRDELAGYQTQTRHDLEIARRILDSVSSSNQVVADNVAYLVRPMEILNGDLILGARKPSGSQCFLVGDFTGHGLPAALGALLLQDVFKSMVIKGLSLDEIAKEINKKLFNHLPVGRFLSLCMLELHAASGTLTVWNGGMPEVVVCGADGKLVCTLPSTTVPLGILHPQEFNATASSLLLRPGDCVYAYSDGLIEAHDPLGEMFGKERLLATVETPHADAQTIFNGLVQGLADHVRGAQQSDDISLLQVRYVPDSATEVGHADTGSRVTRDPASWQFSLTVMAPDLKSNDPIPMLLQVLDTVQGLGGRRTQLYMILTEMYSNAVEHGLLLLDSKLKHGVDGFERYYYERRRRLQELVEGHVAFAFAHRPHRDGGILEITVSHSGAGFDPRELSAPLATNLEYKGRGIRLIESLCESLEYRDDGRTAVATYCWQGEASTAS